MDAKFEFLNGDLEEVCIEKLDGFILANDKNIVAKHNKSLYWLKEAPCAWYYHLDRYLQQQRFKRDM